MAELPTPKDSTECCRICKRTAEKGVKFRELFTDRVTRIIDNTIHIKIEDLPGCPRHVCPKCLEILVRFSHMQLGFRRTEERRILFNSVPPNARIP